MQRSFLLDLIVRSLDLKKKLDDHGADHLYRLELETELTTINETIEAARSLKTREFFNMYIQG
jgi:hypothetical protein